MKISTNQKLLDYQGKEIEGVDIKDILISAVSYEDSENRLTEDQKIRAYRFSLEVSTKDEVEITPELKQQILNGAKNSFTVLIFGRLYDLLNQ